MMGNLYVFVGPSGVGKTTLAQLLLADSPNMVHIPSHTTRERRATESEGVDYFFISTYKFVLMQEAGEFLAHSNVYGNNYGTSAQRVQSALDAGKDVLLILDHKGAQDATRVYPNLVSIFIAPPSPGELVKRLLARGTDSTEVLRVRTQTSPDELRMASEMRYVVINDCVDCAFKQIKQIISDSKSTIN